MTKREITINNILNFLIEIYNRTQTPIKSRTIWQSKKTLRLHSDFEVSKIYTIKMFMDLNILKLVFDSGNKSHMNSLFVWGTDYPNIELARKLHNEKIVKNIKDTENMEDTETENTSSFIDTDGIIETYKYEYDNYTPIKDTHNKLEAMINVLKHNANNRYCDKDIIYSLPDPNDVTKYVSYRASHQYSLRRLVNLKILERNPENHREYRYIIVCDDLQLFIKRLAFVNNYLTNKERFHEIREIRLQKEKEEATQLQENEITTLKIDEYTKSDELIYTENAELKLIRAENNNHLELIRAENNKYLEKIVFLNNVIDKLTEVTIKLTEASLILGKNNVTLEL